MAVPEWPRFTAPLATKEAVIERMCNLLSEAWNVHDPEAHNANDCVCQHGSAIAQKPAHFRSSGQALTWVETLVRAALSVGAAAGSQEKTR